MAKSSETLPFYSLCSILSKFPVEGDSRVFWSGRLRDILYGRSVFYSLDSDIDPCHPYLLHHIRTDKQ